MFKMLFLKVEVEPFKASWGAWFTSQPYKDGFICPLGWEQELTQRGIEFTEIEITQEETNESDHL